MLFWAHLALSKVLILLFNCYLECLKQGPDEANCSSRGKSKNGADTKIRRIDFDGKINFFCFLLLTWLHYQDFLTTFFSCTYI